MSGSMDVNRPETASGKGHVQAKGQLSDSCMDKGGSGVVAITEKGTGTEVSSQGQDKDRGTGWDKAG